VVEGKRTIWQIAKVDINDGGADGPRCDPDNTPIATQGLFVP
jgi:hypothetical protein